MTLCDRYLDRRPKICPQLSGLEVLNDGALCSHLYKDSLKFISGNNNYKKNIFEMIKVLLMKREEKRYFRSKFGVLCPAKGMHVIFN